MASNQHTGLNPLNIPRVDATQSGINSAFATISREIAERTPRESLSAGSLQTGSGKFSVPATPSEQVRPRHAFHAVVYMDAADSSTVKANFQAAYVIEQDDTQFPVFATEADQTVAIADGEKYWVKILVNNDYEVQSASFIQAATTTDVDPSPTSNGEIYKLCVEFDEDAAGKLVVTYHRFDSINYRKPDTSSTSSHPWKATAGGSASIDVARGHIMGFKPYTDGTYGSADFFLPFVEILQTYAGGSVEITEATGFLYATCTVESSVEGQEGAFAGGDIQGNLYRPAAAPTVVFSDVAVTAYDPADAKVHVLLAEVSLVGGVAAVEEQFLFHNPSVQLDSLRNIP